MCKDKFKTIPAKILANNKYSLAFSTQNISNRYAMANVKLNFISINIEDLISTENRTTIIH